MRRLLASLWVLGVVSLSFAHHLPTEPVTGLGQVVAGVMDEWNSTTWNAFMGHYDAETAPGTPYSYPVSFTLAGTNYVGAVEVYDPAQFLSAVMSEYYALHDVLDCEDGPDYPLSGFSVDWFYYYATCNAPSFGFGFIGDVPGVAPAVPPVTADEWFCVSTGGVVWWFGTISYTDSNLVPPQDAVHRYAHGEKQGSPGSTTGHGSSSNFSSASNSLMSHVASNCGTYAGDLIQWQNGTYVGMGEVPVAHDDTVAGLRHLAKVNLAVRELVLGYSQMPPGMRWNPEPSSELYGPCYPDGCADPGNTDTDGDGIPDAEDPCPLNPNPTCGSGGGGPTDPATDPETRCGIIDIPCNLRWLFVPKTGFATHWNRVKTTAEQHFPFNVGSRLVDMIRPSGDEVSDVSPLFLDDEQTVAVACEVQTIDFSGAAGTFLREKLASSEVTYNLCDNVYAEWIHEHLRRWLWYVCVLMIGWSVFKELTRA